jgi:predicted GNAT family N-acyltransferase
VSLEIRRPRDARERDAAMALRHEVFVREQGVPAEEEIDAADESALHLVAVDDADGTVVGTCRLVDGGDAIMRVGRLCVRASARRRGVAAALLGEAEREARAAGAAILAMNAQTHALPLYESLGYEACGERFDEVGIEHLAMEKRLV